MGEWRGCLANSTLLVIQHELAAVHICAEIKNVPPFDALPNVWPANEAAGEVLSPLLLAVAAFAPAAGLFPPLPLTPFAFAFAGGK